MKSPVVREQPRARITTSCMIHFTFPVDLRGFLNCLGDPTSNNFTVPVAMMGSSSMDERSRRLFEALDHPVLQVTWYCNHIMDFEIVSLLVYQLVEQPFQWVSERITWMSVVPPGKAFPPFLSKVLEEYLQLWANLVYVLMLSRPVILLPAIHIQQAEERNR